MNKTMRKVKYLSALLSILLLVGCGSSGGGSDGSSGGGIGDSGGSSGGGSGGGGVAETYTVGGSISGLNGTLVLLNNGGDSCTADSDGGFTFGTELEAGDTFSVAVGSKPASQECTVYSGTGTIAAEDVTGVTVVCNDLSTDDTDGDGVADVDDAWPFDPTKPILSELWGANGELWSSDSRLPFYGFVGYHDGNDPIPDGIRVVADVTDYGAIPDDGVEDTTAFLNALAYAKTQVSADNHGVIRVPAGVFEISKQLHLNKSGLVLKGAGRDATTISFTDTRNVTDKPLDSRGMVIIGGSESGTGLNWIHSKWQTDFCAVLDTTQLPSRGDFIIKLATPLTQAMKDNIAAQGNRMRLAQWLQFNGKGIAAEDGGTGGTSSTPLLAEQIYGGPTYWHAYNLDKEVSTVGSAGTVTLAQEFNATIIDDYTIQTDRPIRWSPTDETRWNEGALVAVRDTSVDWETSEIGLEDLTLEMPPEQFAAHNGSHLKGVDILSHHSWVRRLRVINGDDGVINNMGTSHNTIEDVILDADRASSLYGPGVPYFYPIVGHVGFSAYGNDHMVRDFTLNVSYIHDISTKNSQGNVFMNGEAVEMNMDSHRQVVYENLWTNLHLGSSHRMWDSTGDANQSRQQAKFNTYWNIYSNDPERVVWPADGNWYRNIDNWGYYTQNFVGLGLGAPSTRIADYYLYQQGTPHVEDIDQNLLWPQNLYEAQRKAYDEGLLW